MHRPTLIKCPPRDVKIVPTPLSESYRKMFTYRKRKFGLLLLFFVVLTDLVSCQKVEKLVYYFW